MTIYLLRRLEPDERAVILALLEREVAPRLDIQERGYAAGRRFAWLAFRPSFAATQPLLEPMPRGELWRQLERLVPGIETAECFRNGVGSSPGIRPHRDAAYASRQAWLLNLGETTFRIWLPHDVAPAAALNAARGNAGTKYTEWTVPLVGGELLTFDCKTLHGSHSAAPERWAIGMWRFQDAWRPHAGIAASRP